MAPPAGTHAHAPTTPTDVHELFRLFTLVQADFHKHFLLLDLRDQKHFKQAHIQQAFSVRLSSNGKVLADYSKAEYNTRWTVDIWAGRTVFVYGEPGLSKSHPAVEFLSRGGASNVKFLKEGYVAFEKAYPSCCTPSVRANSLKHYPSQILPGLLYLGDWNHATNTERLQELKVKAVVTIHNHPDHYKPQGMRWLSWSLPDVEVADIAACFDKTFAFIEESRARNEAVLVHCGAGVSRSATLCMMYLMRRFTWSAQKSKEHVLEFRPQVCINDGFWRTLCALEPVLGITHRSDPNATSGLMGEDAGMPKVTAEAAGGKAGVAFMTVAEKQAKRKLEGEGGSAAETQETKKLHTLFKSDPGKPMVVVLDVRKPEGSVGELRLTLGPHQRVIFGRLPTCDVFCEHASISRQHAALSADLATGLMLSDLGGQHGTKLGDIWLKPNTAKQLQKGSTFKLGASSRSYTVAGIE